MAALVVALGLIVGLLAILVVGLLRSHAEILKALHDLGVNLEDGADNVPARRPRPAVSNRAPLRTADGVPRPRDDHSPIGPAVDLTGHLPGGGSARVAVTGVEHATLLAFLSTGCGTCGTFWEALSAPAGPAVPGRDTRVVIVTNGVDSESEAAVLDLAPAGIVTVMSSEAWDDYGVPVSPFFLLVDGPSGNVIGEGSGTSWDQVLDLLGRAVADAGLARPEERADLTRLAGQDRADWVDSDLRAAGIEPGDHSLYPAPGQPVSALTDSGISIELPSRWDGQIRAAGRGHTSLHASTLAPADASPTVGSVLHAASFALPAERGDYGSGAVEVMGGSDILICLLEHEPEAAHEALFRREGLPRLTVSGFSPQSMQRAIAGMSGFQRFFQVAGRPFCLYVVVGTHTTRAPLVRAADDVVRTIAISR